MSEIGSQLISIQILFLDFGSAHSSTRRVLLRLRKVRRSKRPQNWGNGIYISVTGSRCSKTTSLASTVDATFPVSLKASMQKWKENTLLGFPPASSWRNQSGAEYVYIAGIINAHIETLSSQQTQVFSILIKCFSYKSQMEASIIGQPIKICDMYQL